MTTIPDEGPIYYEPIPYDVLKSFDPALADVDRANQQKRANGFSRKSPAPTLRSDLVHGRAPSRHDTPRGSAADIYNNNNNGAGNKPEIPGNLPEKIASREQPGTAKPYNISDWPGASNVAPAGGGSRAQTLPRGGDKPENNRPAPAETLARAPSNKSEIDFDPRGAPSGRDA